MKKIKRILSLSLAAIMLLVMMSVPSFAAGTAEITIQNDSPNTTIVGQEFKVYQVLSATHSGNAYAYDFTADFATFQYKTTPPPMKDFITNIADTVSAGGVEVKDLGGALNTYITANSVAPLVSHTITSGESYTFTGLDEGYYYIVGLAKPKAGGNPIHTVTTLIYVNKDLPTNETTIKVKADAPTIEKQVKENSTGAWGEDADYNIGDQVPFHIIGTIPTYVEQYTNYRYLIHDKMSDGLTFNKTSLKVYSYDKSTGLSTGAISTSNYTVTAPAIDNDSFDLDIASTYIKAHPGEAIIVEFTATLNTSAVMAPAANSNSAKLEYTNNPYDCSDHSTTPDDTVEVYTYEFDIFKYFEQSGTQKPLAGAEFNLFSDEACTTPVDLYKLSGSTYTTTGTAVAAALVSPSTGKIFIKGLDRGDYWVKETKAPDGYYTADNIKVTIDANITTNPMTFTVSENDTAITGNQIDVLNSTSPRLPNTGGIGTKMFYLFGGLLMVGAAVTLITRRRVHGQEK